MLDSPQAYLDTAPDAGRPWLEEFWAHVHDRCPVADAPRDDLTVGRQGCQ
jgi:hypothetical protein